MNADHDAVAEWDAAYVLGALTPADRRRYEEHLAGCEICRTAVGEVAGLPGLLAGADLSAPAAPVPSPPTDLYDRAVRRLDERRSGRRRRYVLGAVVAAVVIGAAVAVPLTMAGSDGPDAVVALHGTGDVAMGAELELRQVAWGTKIEILCDYQAAAAWGDENGPWSYVLVVTDGQGNSAPVASWLAVPGRRVTVDAATATTLTDIASISIRTAAGDTLLTGTP